MMAQVRSPLVVTPGEPAGVGTEITLKAWKSLQHAGGVGFALLSDVDHARNVADKTGIDVAIEAIDAPDDAAAIFHRALPVLHRPLTSPVTLGAFSPRTAGWVTACIEEAADLCLSQHASGMVTCPIQKEALYAAGFTYQGHTDFLAGLCHARGLEARDVMMLVGEGLRAVPVTVHIALKDVASALTTQTIIDQAVVVEHALRTRFRIAAPRIAVTGLNPHAGENGSMGREEIDIIRPAIAALKAQGINVSGPLPADTAFFPQARVNYDAILCMYHDQALIPVKTLDFHGGVNVTLGLPFIRTSPDHGTALALAGTGTAQAESMLAALRLAHDMAQA